MLQIPIIMPQLGESIAEATVIGFLAKSGETVEADQDLIEVETNKATMNVSSPARGKVQEWIAKQDESYAVGEVLGYLEVTKEDAARSGLDSPETQPAGHVENKPANGAISEPRHGVDALSRVRVETAESGNDA